MQAVFVDSLRRGVKWKLLLAFYPYALLTANILWSKNWKQGTILDRTNGQNVSRWSEKPSRVVQVYISDFERSQKNPISVQVNKDRRCHTVFILTIFWALGKKFELFWILHGLKKYFIISLKTLMCEIFALSILAVGIWWKKYPKLIYTYFCLFWRKV